MANETCHGSLCLPVPPHTPNGHSWVPLMPTIDEEPCGATAWGGGQSIEKWEGDPPKHLYSNYWVVTIGLVMADGVDCRRSSGQVP